MYFPQNPEELEQVKTECMKLVNKRAVLSGVAAAVPLPGVDISADITIMVELLTEINKRFGLSGEQISQLDFERKKVLLVIISSVGNELAGKTISATVVRSVLKKVSNKIAARQVAVCATGRTSPVGGHQLCRHALSGQAARGAVLSDCPALHEQH